MARQERVRAVDESSGHRGAGYIGSVVTEELHNDGHTVVVFDNLKIKP